MSHPLGAVAGLQPNPQSTIAVEVRSVFEFTLSKAAYTLRILLLLVGLVGLVSMVSGDQVTFFNVPSSPSPVAIKYKFTYSPSFIYLMITLTMTCIYALLTASLYYRSLSKPPQPASFLMLFILSDMANGEGASIAYLGSKGDSHVGWTPMCGYYGKFYRHIKVSLIVSVIGSVILSVLVMITMNTVYHRLKTSAAKNDLAEIFNPGGADVELVSQEESSCGIYYV